MKSFKFLSIAAALIVLPGVAVSCANGYFDDDIDITRGGIQNKVPEPATRYMEIVLEPTVIVVPRVNAKSMAKPTPKPKPPVDILQEFCYSRPLEQGEGSVIICERMPASEIEKRRAEDLR